MDKAKLQELLDSMTLQEKVGQMFQGSAPMFGTVGAVTGNVGMEWVTPEIVYTMGSVLNVFSIERMKKLQDFHLQHSKIPLIFMMDIICGYNTIFPLSPAMAGTFNRELIKQTARISAKEAAAHGVNVTFSPMVDISRDSRWGRGSEGYGEDPCLSSMCAAAMVEGYQGDDLSSLDTVAACVKHFAAYGATYDGKDYNSTDMSERVLRGVYLPPYKAAVDAGAALIMTSFNTINGVPATINHHTNVDILRNEWGFDGVVITDYASALYSYHEGGCNSEAENAQLCIESQVDIDMMDEVYSLYIKKALDQGLITIEQVDACVMRILELKNKLGVLDDPYRYMDETAADKLDYEAHNAVARRAIYEGSALLKNDDKVLPLKKTENIAFIGPFTHMNDLVSEWSKIVDTRHKGVTLVDALKEREDITGNNTICRGTSVLRKEEFSDIVPEDPCYDEPEKYFAEAIEKAKNADTVVMYMGESSLQFGESRSRTEASMPEVQMELLREIHKVNQNIIVVLFNGRPLALTEVSELSKAILDVWYPGTEGHRAILDMLFGDEVPSGRLPFCFPRKPGQTPLFYSYLVTGHANYNGKNNQFGLRYLDTWNTPLYPFGYGLSYTDFEYSNLRLSADEMTVDGKIIASVDIENKGERDAYETVQLYIRDRYAKFISRPVKEMKDFKKVFIKKCEKVTVSFEITEPMLRYYNINDEYVSEKGLFHAFVAPHSYHEEYKEFNLI